jgi:hypothetical protein
VNICPRCRQGQCEDCATLGMWCDCCGTKVNHDDEGDGDE